MTMGNVKGFAETHREFIFTGCNKIKEVKVVSSSCLDSDCGIHVVSFQISAVEALARYIYTWLAGWTLKRTRTGKYFNFKERFKGKKTRLEGEN